MAKKKYNVIREEMLQVASNVAEEKNIDQDSVFSAMDLVPTLIKIAGAESPEGIRFDGECLPDVLLGKSSGSRESPLFFRRPPDRDAFYGDNDLPDLAIRKGKWKLLCEYDGSEAELYNLDDDRGEKRNLAQTNNAIVSSMKDQLIRWHESMPPDNGEKLVKKK